MNSFNTIPITITELIKWKNEPDKNPRTNRKISINGILYKYISFKYEQYILKENQENKLNNFKNKIFNLEDSIDDKDPVTLNTFWIIEDGKKKIVYSGNRDNLVFYKDNHNLIRCFEKETLEYMKAHKITKNPITQEDIPSEIFDSIKEKNLEEERKNMTIPEKALEVFQKFSSLSIFIDSEWFLELSKEKLKKFNYEASSFYKENLNQSQRNEISLDNKLNKKESELESMSLENIQLYILNEIDILLNVKKEELKYMINYILIGALGIVIPAIKELYPDFSYAF